MLELQVVLPKTRTICGIRTPAAREDHVDLPFTVYSGRLGKRLVRVNQNGPLELHFDLPCTDVCIAHFALVRVTQRFATSRMHKRLMTSHPAYRITVNRTSAPLPTDALWHHYCDVFEEGSDIGGYTKWVQAFGTLSETERDAIRVDIGTLASTPLISVVMPVYNPRIDWLREAIESVRAQLYDNWELCIADDASTDSQVGDLLDEYRSKDSRIKSVRLPINGHISAASNGALELATGEWVAFLDQDDLLAEHALFEVVSAIGHTPAARIIYSDEDKIDEAGLRSDPYFKSEWNPDLFYSHNFFCHLSAYKRSLISEIGGFRIGFEGAQDYDLALRCIERTAATEIHHIPRVLYHWRAHSSSTASQVEIKSYALDAGRRALQEHFARRGIAAEIENDGVAYRLRYRLPDVLPLVSLVIPTRNSLHLLQRCIESILKKTTYSPYEILIVDNGSDDPSTLRYLRKLADEKQIQVIRDDEPFNYSRLNNLAARHARGAIFGLVNNDIEVITPDWLSEMVSHAARPEIGCVGARLWYPDDTLQHAGVVLGIHDIAGHVHRFFPQGHPGARGRASVIQAFSAVTGACLVVRKDVFEEVGGLNERELAITCNDVDFCLRVQAAGYRNIWTPYAELYHHESATRGHDDTPEKCIRTAREVAYMKQMWGDLLHNDPAYNPNLTLEAEDFGYAWPPRCQASGASSKTVGTGAHVTLT
ncbi:glycosyltransferase involved in cell wall biosynthesis [Paraburkholderia bannensis]|uniref:Glycosyltransferase involved in cell wall biosynthesis n=1 Tax=Paraburkholderia bannensis TaxID=765414 RepID=A0A7W9TX63_9BURK|nr:MULTISPECIES: glycosyltransferase family 2 protein [Paraburkholderia]MBB3258038.1 glycosyltransferase involved in cell wall biosynthesis [Paraburkholderia sp. WP4_3_2]MBB6103051.1 glycosyltransferase involved in cell wall biosynthesis [Paraburkholderia bannensis]